jgi:exopolysaccharide biosynthesis polyprenyl glycosylphosphotransferase
MNSTLVPHASAADSTTSSQGRLQRRSAYRHHGWVYLSLAGDVIMVALAMIAAFWTRFTTLENYGHFTSHDLETYLPHLVLGTASLVLIMAWRGLYRRDMLLQPMTVVTRIAKCVVFWTGGFLLFALVFETQPAISRIYMILAGAWTLVLLAGWRAFFHAQLKRPEILSTLQRRTLVVGTGEDVTELVERYRNTREQGSKITGWVVTPECGQGPHEVAGIPCLGPLDRLQGLLEAQAADMLILTDLSGPRERSLQIASLCERELVSFKIIPSCFRIFVSGLQLENVAGTVTVGVSRLPLDSSANVLVKRCLDLLGGVIGLLMAAPIIALFSALVRWEGRGNVIYRQVRTGADGRDFTIYKIRSMKLDAETAGAQWCVADDPRRLRVGAFMRKWNIDELPQFWNVVKGEMSLVGPRPERPELIAQFKHSIPHYNARHHALPGMTGWAQVCGLRGDTDLAERIRADIWYLENWSLLLDLKIMLMTFFKRDNAY